MPSNSRTADAVEHAVFLGRARSRRVAVLPCGASRTTRTAMSGHGPLLVIANRPPK